MVAIAVIIILGGIFYFSQRQPATGPAALNQSDQQQAANQLLNQPGEQKDTTITKDNFSILMPLGWKETRALPGLAMMAINFGEQITDPALQKINFKTNYAVGFDTMDTRKYRNFSEYVEHVKTLTSQMAPGVVFGAEQDQTIGANKVHTIEASLTQAGMDFQTLIAVIPGNNNDVWTITFNTPKVSWDSYQTTFKQILASFKIK